MFACKLKGIIQLVHGFTEHSSRYLHMIVNLMEAGYIISCDDHVGHSKTAIVNISWGDYGKDGY
ncbi:serine aminopeptidase domain-containing protein [Floccifex sp.]|uniref:serine aminopeptidase domain-containing protein n=1 Tax=Floccifex sp. TaxID=2815810 RepID=UPI003F0F4748